jgi:hypothetical protein
MEACWCMRSWRGNGTHASGGRILFVVGSEWAVQAEAGFAKAVMTGVRGPHAGEDLGHGAKVLLHGLLAYWFTVGGKVADTDLMGKHLEQWDWIVNAVEGGAETEVSAEGGPLSPVGAASGGAAGMDASSNLVLAKAVDSPCRCCDVRWSIRQDVACGNSRSKKEQSCESESSHRQEAAPARWLFCASEEGNGGGHVVYGPSSDWHSRDRSRAATSRRGRPPGGGGASSYSSC